MKQIIAVLITFMILMSGLTTGIIMGRENNLGNKQDASIEVQSPTGSELIEPESSNRFSSLERSEDTEIGGWFAGSYDDLTRCTPNGISIYGIVLPNHKSYIK